MKVFCYLIHTVLTRFILYLVKVSLWVCFEEVGHVGIHDLALGKMSEDICMRGILISPGSEMNYSFDKFYLQKIHLLDSKSFKV